MLFHECRRRKSKTTTGLGRLALSLSLLVATATYPGCGGSAGRQIQRYDPATAAAKAIELYDKNGDGKLSADELRQSPALSASLRRMDGNRDGALTAEEIQARLEELDRWAKFIPLETTVTARGNPLVGAEVTLTPEPFLGESFPTLSGTTEGGGICRLMPEGPDILGTPVGFYSVRIVHMGQRIDTVRGVEIAEDTTGSRLEIAL